MKKQGDNVTLLKAIKDRIAFYAQRGVPGSTTISIAAGTVLVAACDEFGGNIYVSAADPQGKPLLVPLAEGEWS
ncbi:MAG: hypothetical protein P4N60_10170 [Verrucomicrobiae bacterium]|nr:hypothetical protein [Verrucomicrobiae bacterium]